MSKDANGWLIVVGDRVRVAMSASEDYPELATVLAVDRGWPYNVEVEFDHGADVTAEDARDYFESSAMEVVPPV